MGIHFKRGSILPIIGVTVLEWRPWKAITDSRIPEMKNTNPKIQQYWKFEANVFQILFLMLSFVTPLWLSKLMLEFSTKYFFLNWWLLLLHWLSFSPLFASLTCSWRWRNCSWWLLVIGKSSLIIILWHKVDINLFCLLQLQEECYELRRVSS